MNFVSGLRFIKRRVEVAEGICQMEKVLQMQIRDSDFPFENSYDWETVEFDHSVILNEDGSYSRDEQQ